MKLRKYKFVTGKKIIIIEACEINDKETPIILFVLWLVRDKKWKLK